ncbi:DUF4099 domain-containing protein [Mucilaginibacter sp. X5P1]|uniref:DUF4099 domain-containing protein n=1 Tax=Mucilaginibacter sp. X5P1 TaxID=2723088 RepID=UPI00161C791C|nr:DUF4099 domain-containing protein [Mucilaginibacter sp. X5P1]MBB6141705.1 hypothetical protein [Mucilaginibacter sp. X5P1]
MIKQIYDERALPMKDLEALGLAEDGKLNIDKNDLEAILSGRRTDMLRLENLSAQGIHIPALDAKLSVKLNVDGGLELLVHPIYRKAEHPFYLTDTEAENLEKGEAVNIQKQIIDQQGRKREILVEFDKDTQEFIITDSERILVPDTVNGQYLSLEQKERYRKGKEVELQDGTTFQYSASEPKGIRSNKLALIASVLIDGGLSYVLYTGLHALFGQKHDKEKANTFSKGYHDDVEKMQEQEVEQESEYSNKAENQYSRGYSQTNSR